MQVCGGRVRGDNGGAGLQGITASGGAGYVDVGAQ